MPFKTSAKIAIINGTRAEFIKTFPLMKELKRRKIPYYFIYTAQNSLGDLWKVFGTKKPDAILSKEFKKGSKFNSKRLKAVTWNLGMVRRIRKELKKLPNLKYVVYHGDTMTTASAAIASSRFLNPFKKYKNVHLESGLRSFNLKEPFPEELSRRLSGRFSDILFVPSFSAKKNVEKLKRKKILVFGNTIIDSAHEALKIARKKKIKSLSRGKFALVTIHRYENLINKKRMEKIVDILCEIPIKSYFMIHGNTLDKLKKFGLFEKLKSAKNVKLVEPIDYVNFIYQMSKCSLIVCDGGSMQEESLVFKKPCIILRKSTERPEGLETNFQFLSNFDLEKSLEKMKEFLSPKFKIKKFKNPYGEKGLTKKIVDVLTK